MDRMIDFSPPSTRRSDVGWQDQALEYMQTHGKYTKCLVGGALSSSLRWVLTPLDTVKCKMQINATKYPTLSSGLATVFKEQGVGGLYRGLVPTILSYGTQTGTKYCLYEVFKDTFQDRLDPADFARHRSAIYIASSASAEAVADVLMCPWEMLKVKVQTSSSFPARFGPALTAMIQQRHQLQFPFGSLKPLWSRQIIGTVANFVTFEYTAEAIYTHILTEDKESYSPSTQLATTMAAGFSAGVVSATLSHPFDVLMSVKAKHPEMSIRQVIHEQGWQSLFRGLGPRVVTTGSILCFQWFVYDAFKSALGMGTTGGKVSKSS